MRRDNARIHHEHVFESTAHVNDSVGRNGKVGQGAAPSD
jgi:hypothetical protein